MAFPPDNQGDDGGGLDVTEVAAEGDDSPVTTAVVLLHGWGAAGDDLVALADELVRPGTRFFVPEGPLVEMGGGRAWWHLDDGRPVHAYDDQPPGRPPSACAGGRLPPAWCWR